MKLLATLFVTLSFFVVGCTSEEEVSLAESVTFTTATPGSCRYSQSGATYINSVYTVGNWEYCTNYQGKAISQSQAKIDCSSTRETYSESKCDITGCIGQCTIDKDDGLTSRKIYYFSLYTASNAEILCGYSKGTFSATCE